MLEIDEKTLHKRLAALEVALGRPLFTRRPRAGAVPTIAGEYLLSRAEPLRGIFDRLEGDMASIRTLDHKVSVAAPAGVMHYTLAPTLLGNNWFKQPLTRVLTGHSMPPLDLIPDAPSADVRVVLTPKKMTPDLDGAAIVQRVGTMHFAPFIAIANLPPVRIETRHDLKKFKLCQRSDYATVPSMAAWNDVCEQSDSTINFTNSVDMHKSVLSDRTISIFPSYSHFYEKGLASCSIDDLGEISLSVWLTATRDGLRDPPVRRVFVSVRF